MPQIARRPMRHARFAAAIPTSRSWPPIAARTRLSQRAPAAGALAPLRRLRSFLHRGLFRGAAHFAPVASEALVMHGGRTPCHRAARRRHCAAYRTAELRRGLARCRLRRWRTALTAAEWGFEAVGLDTRAAHVAGLRQLGLEAHEGTLEDLDAPGRFGVVSLEDQLPRMIDPAARLPPRTGCCSADGLLLLGLPNMDAMAFNLLHAQDANPHWSEITHYHMFGRARLYALLREQGFQPLEYQVNPKSVSAWTSVARLTSSAKRHLERVAALNIERGEGRSLNSRPAAATFSARCSGLAVPGIGSMIFERLNSQASAIWLGVAFSSFAVCSRPNPDAPARPRPTVPTE